MSTNDSFSNFIEGAGHGFLALFGAGAVYDPMGDKRSDLSQAKSDMQTTINNMTLEAIKVQASLDEDFYNFMKVQQDTINDQNALTDAQIWDAIKQENMFLVLISVLVIIIVFFMLIRNDCK